MLLFVCLLRYNVNLKTVNNKAITILQNTELEMYYNILWLVFEFLNRIISIDLDLKNVNRQNLNGNPSLLFSI
jgi:hypothetical protein